MPGNITGDCTLILGQIVVDGARGNNSQGGRYGSAVKDLARALSLAVAGDTIIVAAGTYTGEFNLTLKTLVNWHFMPGAKVYSTSATNLPIFTDAGTAVDVTISGRGEFYLNGTGVDQNIIPGGGVIKTNHASTVINFEAKYCENNQNDTGSFILACNNCSKFIAKVDELYNTLNAAGGSIAWLGGDMYVKGFKNTAAANSIVYTVWCKEPVATAVANGYFEFDLIDNPHYSAITNQATSTGWKVWVVAKEIRGTLGGASEACMENLGGGKLYVKAQKILTTNAVLLKQTGGEVWIEAQKITSDLTALDAGLVAPYSRFLRITAGNCDMVCMHWEITGNQTLQAWLNSGGVVNITGGRMTNPSGAGYNHGSGTSRVKGMFIDTSTTNAAGNNAVILGANGMNLQNCLLITPALADSITGAFTVKCWSCAATRAINAGTTSIGTLSINAALS